MKFFILLFLFANLFAQDDYSLRVAYGKPTTSDFGQVIIGDIESHPKDLSVISLDAGYLLKKDLFEFPVDAYAKVGFSYFDEDGTHDDVFENTLYLKLYYNMDFWGNRVRFGLGEGISYTSAVLYAEAIEAESKKDNTSRFLNYIDLSLDVDLGRLIGYKKLEGTSLGWALKHRSGIFGIINNVESGGSNYNTIFVEAKF